MQIGIIGTGPVGRAFGRALPALGHQVVVGTRDVAQTRGRAEWSDSGLELVPYADLTSELFILVTGGSGALPALGAVGAALDGRVVVDVSNPLDFSRGARPHSRSATPTRWRSSCSGRTRTPGWSRRSTPPPTR